MALYIDENDYPQNYDWVPEDKQQVIIEFMNGLRNRTMRTFQLGRSSVAKKSEHKNFIERRWRELSAQEDAILDFLNALGIKLECGWVGHRDTYFFATYNDAIAEQDYYDDIARDAEGDVDEYRLGGDYDSEDC